LTRNWCSRRYVLCVENSVAFLLADSTKDILLVPERIGLHSVERDFGTTRSTLCDDTCWVNFFRAQVSAMLIQLAMTDLRLRPDIRRLKSGASCTLFGSDDQGCVEADLTNMIAKVKRMGDLLSRREEQLVFQENEPSVIAPFHYLAHCFAQIEWDEKRENTVLFQGVISSLVSLPSQREHRLQQRNKPRSLPN
jgi:hypothetical protein